MTATLRSHTKGYTTSNGNVLTVSHSTQSGDRLLVIVGGIRTSESLDWDFNVTFDGSGGSLIGEVSGTHTNRSYWLKAYAFTNPSIGSSKQLRVESTFNLSRIGAFIGSYNGASGFGAVEKASVNSTTEQTVSPSLSAAFSLVAVAGLGRVSASTPVWTFDAPAYLTDSLLTNTSSDNVDLTIGLGHAAATSTGSLALTLDCTNVPETIALAVEVLSEGEFEASALATASASPFLATASATPSTTVPTVLVGSIPPTQVLWQGNLFFSTKTRTINVLFLTVNGSDWVQPTSGGAAQTVGLTVKRRKAYLIPQ